VAVATAGLYASLHLAPDNHTSTPPLSFLQAGCPSCHPTNSVKALKELKKAKRLRKHKYIILTNTVATTEFFIILGGSNIWFVPETKQISKILMRLQQRILTEIVRLVCNCQQNVGSVLYTSETVQETPVYNLLASVASLSSQTFLVNYK